MRGKLWVNVFPAHFIGDVASNARTNRDKSARNEPTGRTRPIPRRILHDWVAKKATAAAAAEIARRVVCSVDRGAPKTAMRTHSLSASCLSPWSLTRVVSYGGGAGGGK